MKKHLIFSFFLVFFSLTAFSQNTMTIKYKDGTSKSVLISKIDEVIFEELPDSYVTHEYVDLGLSVKWATCNVGATSPEDYGDYFAWGETTGYNAGKTTFEWGTYSLCGGSETTLTKYCKDSSYGTVDNKTVLDSSDDAATANWGGAWRMPTSSEQSELRNFCYWEWTSGYNGTDKAGYIVYKAKYDSDKGVKKYGDGSTSATVNGSYSLCDTHIFLPAAGQYNDSGLTCLGICGDYWTRELTGSESYFASDEYLSSSAVNAGGGYRYCGQSVRAVCP